MASSSKPQALFTNYTHQPLPDLGSLSRHPAQGPCAYTISVPDETAAKLVEATGNISSNGLAFLRAAYASSLMRYLDTQDVLLAETELAYLHDPEAVWLRLIRAMPTADQSWATYAKELERWLSDEEDTETCLEDARLDLFVDKSHTPLPSLIIWDLAKATRPNSYAARSIAFGAHVSSDGSVGLDFLVDSALICRSSLEIFASQVSITLSHILENTTTSCTSPIPMPPHLHAAIPGEADPANEKLALDWLFENARNRPDAIAHEIYATLEEQPLMLTYGELNRKSNALAHWLVSKGIKVEDKVPLCSSRSQYFYIAMAAVLKAGGCYVSIDPELPLERKTFIADDSDANLVFTAAEDEPTFGDRSVLLSETLLADALASFGGEDVCHATLDSLAYLLYTSGTTGNPKGCLLEHRGLYWAMLSFCALPKPVTNPDTDKRLALASTAFDVHISEIVQSWCLGSRLVSAPRFELLTQLRKHVVDIGITHMGMVPSMIEALLQKPDGLPLKYLVSGGEKITDSLLEKWSNREGLVLANFYGPTEATIGCTSRRVGLYDRKENIGRAFPSCSAFVVDRNLEIVPIGCPGELIVGGPLIARGYHGLPEATAKAFIDFPKPGDRAYRTGDLVRMMADGSIEIMGRIDLQVKYRGVRIETEGVSSILVSASEASSIVASTFITTHPAVANELLVSVVAPRESTVSIETRRTTVPDLLHTDDAKALIHTLKKAVDAKLPVYQRPAYILPVAFMPLSFNGKTDNKVLGHLVRNLDMGTLLEVQGGKA